MRSAFWAFVMFAPALAIGLVLEHAISVRGASLVFIAAVVGCAARFGFLAGIFSAVLCFLALNFFFIEPRYTLLISDPAEYFSLGVFLVVASITGSLAGRLREQVTEADRRAHLLKIVSDFSGSLFETKTELGVVSELSRHISSVLNGPVAILRERSGEIDFVTSTPGDMPKDAIDLFAVEQVLRKGHAVMAVAPGWGGNRFEYRPVIQAGLKEYALAIAPSGGNRSVPGDAEQTLATMLDQASLAIERMRFAEETGDARAQAQEEKLRSTLLSSVSHDLRTPLAAILGSVTSLRELGKHMPEAAKDELLEAIESETRRLSRLVANLLDMTKLQSGIQLQMQFTDISDIIKSSMAAIKVSFPARHFEAVIAPNLPAIECDPALTGQVFFNLLENAAKFSKAPDSITVKARAEGSVLMIDIIDRGTGIAPKDRGRVFQRFFSSGPSEGKGAGLGLAICHGIVEAMGGRIFVAETGREAGTTMRVELPLPARPEILVKAAKA